MLNEQLKNYNVILASGSPRRQQFLKDLELDFTIQLKEVEEIYPENLKGSEITDFLAQLKSDVFQDLKENDLLITSDTIVWMDNKAIGKPKNKEEAIKIFHELSGTSHEVITSICIKTITKTKIINDTTKVYFKNLTNKEINYYINNFNPYDKAGGYGIQDWIGFIGVEKIEGNFFNVMGLPIYKLYSELLKF
ncbi:Maf family nucleotide pyrophosphatase [Urechidicola croceus]|uniref:dTTP/UTP pyrophosphatase n=1 Tax=Urechidicola croceus TaxID=1850246 RepID=A0A1D8P5L0_9FLAO|nr:Maf family nucleotide pyrophosphatase [Urechidicola croceus]AOW19866.1 septum formation protein Maf [Urechidicola croceus]